MYPTAVAELVRFLLRLPPDLFAELQAWANEDERSLNRHIVFLLTQAVRRRKGP